MKKTTFKKMACCMCAAAASAATLVTFASCETSYPKAEIVVLGRGITVGDNVKVLSGQKHEKDILEKEKGD